MADQKPGALPAPAQSAGSKAAETNPPEAKPAEGKSTESSPPEAKPAGTSAVVLDLNAVRGLMGRAVKSSTNEDMGHVFDILVASDGRIRAVILDFGGVLGVGSRKVAVDWRTLSFADLAKDGPVQVLLTRNQIRVAPEYKPNEAVVVLEGSPEPATKGQVPGQAPGKVEPAGQPQVVAPAPTSAEPPKAAPEQPSK